MDRKHPLLHRKYNAKEEARIDKKLKRPANVVYKAMHDIAFTLSEVTREEYFAELAALKGKEPSLCTEKHDAWLDAREKVQEIRQEVLKAR